MKRGCFRPLRLLMMLTALLLVGCLVFGIVCYRLAVTDNIREKYTMTETDDSFLWTALKSAVTGKEFEVTEVQLNTYLNKKFCGSDKILQHIRVYSHEEQPVEIYAQIRYWGQEFALSARLDTSLNAEEGIVTAALSDVKLGELPIHSLLVDSILREFAEKNDNVTWYNGTLLVRSRYQYNFDDIAITLRLTAFEPSDGIIRCQTNSLTHELWNALKQYVLSGKASAAIKELLQDSLKAILHEGT